jgi:hypothetical protein
MLIMSLQSKFVKRVAALVLGVLFATESPAGSNNDWIVMVGKSPTIKMNGKQISLNRTLKAQMRSADEAVFLPVNIQVGPQKLVRWLVLRSPSRISGKSGFCGAGHEDRLLLIEISGLTAKRVDELLLQSCLKSISMDVDQLDELTKAFSQDGHDGALTFQQSVSSDASTYRQVVKIHVGQEKMCVETERLRD